MAQGMEVRVFYPGLFQELVIVPIEGCVTQRCVDSAGKNKILL